MIWAFLRRDLKIRYAQTSFGILWLFAQPLAYLLTIVFVFITSYQANLGNIPYSLFAVSGLMIWTYISFASTQAGNSLIGSLEIIQKTYFPRLIIPIAKSFLGLLDLLVVCLFVFILLIYYNVSLTVNIIALPFILVATILIATSIGILVSIITVRFRDIQHLTPFAVQIGLFISPVIYPAESITSSLDGIFSYAYYLNPVSGLISAARWAIFGLNVSFPGIIISGISGLILIGLSLFLFNRIERDLSDKL